MLRRRVPVLKLGWEVTKRRCVVSAKCPQAFAKLSQASAKRSQAFASGVTRAVKGEVHRTRADAAFRIRQGGVPNPSS